MKGIIKNPLFVFCLLILITGMGIYGVFADYVVSKDGAWPQNWPIKLEPLRNQSRSLEGGFYPIRFHEISFKDSSEFKRYWPTLLSLKSSKTSITLLKSPDPVFGNLKAGVRIKCVPLNDLKAKEESVVKPKDKVWIELIVDGEIIDLNKVPLPGDAPIYDKRFDVRK